VVVVGWFAFAMATNDAAVSPKSLWLRKQIRAPIVSCLSRGVRDYEMPADCVRSAERTFASVRISTLKTQCARILYNPPPSRAADTSASNGGRPKFRRRRHANAVLHFVQIRVRTMQGVIIDLYVSVLTTSTWSV